MHVFPLGGESATPGASRVPVPLADGDWLLVRSGGIDKVADPVAVRTRSAEWAGRFPKSSIYAFTSGLENVRRLASELGPPVVGIFYDYEPNYPNEPEFSFDPATTARNLGEVTQLCHARGLRSVAYLTGRAILSPQQRWDYASFRPYVDDIVVQTQSSIRQGVGRAALDTLAQQFGTARPVVQITLSPGLPNAVDLPAAQGAYADMRARGFDRIVLWWIPRGDDQLVALLGGRGGADGPR